MKPQVCVLFGGKSSEHEVSCISAYNVVKNLNREKYDLFTVGIDKQGNSFLYSGDSEHIKDGSWQTAAVAPCVISPNPAVGGLLVQGVDGAWHTKKVDVFFPVLHGKNGEDGTVQGVFELSEIPYVGTGVLCSSVCMDKIFTKQILEANGIVVTPGFFITAEEVHNTEEIHEKILSTVGYPVIVKPSNAGSSVGVSVAKSQAELAEALTIAAKEDRRILIEKMLKVREVECAVLGTHAAAEASLPGEIVKNVEVYDYETKYIEDTVTLQIPAELPDEIIATVRETAVRAFLCCDGTGLCRVDFFITEDTGEIFLNEINTLPGFTDISMYPMMWAKTGLPYSALLDRLIENAFLEHGDKKQ